MSESAIIKKVRQSNTSPTGAPCNSCPSVGLPILPVRYAVVPQSLPGAALPQSCSQPLLSQKDHTKVRLSHSRYALRAMRAGFLYLHYKEDGGNLWTWQCYMISPNGALRQIPLSTPRPVNPTEMSCQRGVEHVINSSIIAINKPEKVAKVYIAYSEHFWTEKTLARMSNHGPRFIEFSPSAWLAEKRQQHAFAPNLLEQGVVDYGQSASSASLKDSASDVLPRQGLAPQTIKRMDAILEGQGVVLAIPDPVGCVRELNTRRLHALEVYKTYLSDPEIAWKRSCAMQIQGLRDYVQAQAQEALKDAKTRQVGRGTVKTKAQQIKEKTAQGWARFESHYSESDRSKFLEGFQGWCNTYVERITQWDADYAPWLDSESLALAMQDYDLTAPSGREEKTLVAEALLAGGVLSRASENIWKAMLAEDVAHIKNYAISGILQNQQAWMEGFKTANHTTIEKYLGDNSGKGFDVLRNGAESKGAEDTSKAVNKALNHLVVESSARLLHITNGAINALFAKADQFTKDEIVALETLQAKIGLAYARTQTNIDVVLLKVELTTAEWHRVISSQLRKSVQGTVKTVSDTLSQMATAAMLQVPPNSTAGQALVSFAFWVAGSPKQVEAVLLEFGRATGGVVQQVGGVAGRVAHAGASAIAATGQGTAGAAVGGAKEGLRAVRVIAHNLKESTAYLLQIPARVLPTRALAFAAAATRNGLTILGTMDVRLALVGAGFQAWALRGSIKEYEGSIGFKSSDTSWAIASAFSGLLGATLDVVGKAAIVKGGKKAVVNLGIVKIAAQRLVTSGGLLGAFASFVDCGQALMRAYTFGKRGDTDARNWLIGLSIASAFGGVAGVFVAFGHTAFFGPVGLLIACIAAGVVLTYLAFMAEDSAVEIWLDRCKFGAGKRAEGKFTSMQQECDALELVGRNVLTEIEWRDTLSTSYDDIAILIKRPANKGDAVNFGLILQGSGVMRQISHIEIEAAGMPNIVSSNVKQPDAPEVKDLIRTVSSTAGIQTTEVSLAVSRAFNQARVWLRYIPDVQQPTIFHDDVLLLAD